MCLQLSVMRSERRSGLNLVQVAEIVIAYYSQIPHDTGNLGFAEITQLLRDVGDWLKYRQPMKVEVVKLGGLVGPVVVPLLAL